MSKKLLRKKLALMLANLKKKRKYYCEVEYLESTGTQYIDTGLSMPNGFRATGTYEITQLDATGGIIGTYTNSAPYKRNFYDYTYGSGNRWLIGYGGDAYQYFGAAVANTKYTFDISNILNSEHLITNGTTYTVTPTGTKGEKTSFNLYLFALNINNVANNFAKMKLYCIQVYNNNGNLVRDFIPVLDWNYTPCMFDRVTEQLFYNAGTGDFTAGREIHYVDYLESTGTQYIDTGITLTSNHSVEVDYQLTSASQNRKGIFGGLVTNGPRFGALLSPSNNYLEFGYGSTNVWYQPGLPDTQRHIMKQQKNLLYFDGVLAYTFSTATFTQNFTAPLGNFNYTNYNPASAKYYSSKWWDNDTIVRDYLPAIDENGVGFMFDRVSHTIYDNAGTGAFKYPPKELYYIGGTGTQYINTNFYPNENTKIEIVGSVLPDNPPACFCATRWSQSPTYDTYGAYYNFANNEKRFVCYWGRYSDNQYDQVPVTQFNFLQGFFKYTQDKNVLTLEGIDFPGSYTKTFTNTAFQVATYPLWLFRFNAGSASFTTKGAKIRTAKIWDNGTLTRNYIAAYKDGLLGLYEKVNGILYQNAGTGSFTAGKIVEPEYE